jgi:hypothetical protein
MNDKLIFNPGHTPNYQKYLLCLILCSTLMFILGLTDPVDSKLCHNEAYPRYGIY